MLKIKLYPKLSSAAMWKYPFPPWTMVGAEPSNSRMRTALATESAFLISFSARNGIFRALDCTETFKNYIETRRYATWLALRGSSVFCNRSQRRGRRKSAKRAPSRNEEIYQCHTVSGRALDWAGDGNPIPAPRARPGFSVTRMAYGYGRTHRTRAVPRLRRHPRSRAGNLSGRG